MERRLISRELMNFEGDRGVAVNAAGKISVMVNEQDHVRLQCLDSGCRPAEAWAALDAVDDALATQLDFAFDQRRGFLTSSPADSGTGMRVSFLAHLPGLILVKNIDQTLLAAQPNGHGRARISGRTVYRNGRFISTFQHSWVRGVGERIFGKRQSGR